MNRRFVYLGLGVGVAIALLYSMRSQIQDFNSQTDLLIDDEPSFIDEIMSTTKNLIATVDQNTLLDSNVQAFFRLIRTGEGTLSNNGYRTLFGGRLFDSFADHPRIVVKASGYSSPAAGAYQFLPQTWDEMADKYNLPDFSPHSQDIAALGLIKRRGALVDVIEGRFKSAIKKCNKEWASLPGSPYGQPTLTYAKAAQVLAQAGAAFTETVA